MKSSFSRTAKISGTAILAALVVLFDYTLKFSGLKIPFPWMPMLKFDFTGAPIALSLFLYSFLSAFVTSLVAFIAIIVRSGDPIGASMKFIAEFSTVLGLAIGSGLSVIVGFRGNFQRSLSYFFGIIFRVVFMSLMNILILPNFYGVPFNITLGMLPMIGIFNVFQGSITILMGYFLFEAYTQRLKK